MSVALCSNGRGAWKFGSSTYITDAIAVLVFAGNSGEKVLKLFILKIDGTRNHVFCESQCVYCDYGSFQQKMDLPNPLVPVLETSVRCGYKTNH